MAKHVPALPEQQKIWREWRRYDAADNELSRRVRVSGDFLLRLWKREVRYDEDGVQTNDKVEKLRELRDHLMPIISISMSVVSDMIDSLNVYAHYHTYGGFDIRRESSEMFRALTNASKLLDDLLSFIHMREQFEASSKRTVLAERKYHALIEAQRGEAAD